jgi:threonine/homoserine/homoserine lactone efflux protein
VDLLITGAFAGLALAIPLGPMAILLISTTIKHGRGIGVFGALAMATVDLCYAAVVFAFGNLAISLLTNWLVPMRLAGSLILAVVAVRIFLDARRSSALNLSSDPIAKPTRFATFAKFFGLTVLNPATAFYFVGITPSVAELASTGDLVLGVSLFALGVFLGSLVWQFGLVFAATITSNFTNHKVQQGIQYLGGALILVLAVILILR